MRHFTRKEDKFLWDNYLAMPAKRMAKMLNRSEGTARQRMVLLGIVVPPEVIQKFKEDSQFKIGAAPINKGKKQIEFLSKEGIERSKLTRFKNGSIPPNTLADLAVTIRTDNRGVKGKFIRIAAGVWVPLHRYNWEQIHGPIPVGMKIIYKDGDTMNCDISNLQLVTCAELMKLNSMHNYPKEITHAIQLRGALNRQINKHVKKLNHEK